MPAAAAVSAHAPRASFPTPVSTIPAPLPDSAPIIPDTAPTATPDSAPTAAPDAVSRVFQNQVDKQTPHVIAGKGCYITVEDPTTGQTKQIFDAMTGAAVGALGWGDERAIQSVADAARDSSYSYSVYFGNKNAEALAQFYIENSRPGAFTHALFVGSGSEANESAMKIMKQYYLERQQPRKHKFITRNICYHGFSVGTMSLSANPRAYPFRDIGIPQSQLPKTDVCYPFRFKKPDQSLSDYVQQLLSNLESLILKEDPASIAGIILETLPGSSIGTVPPPPGYLSGVRKLCDKYDILFHLDEVMCGTGRCADPKTTHGLNCWEQFLAPGMAPDIQTVGKTLGSGFVTIAGVLIGPKISSGFNQGSGTVVGSHTYASHSFNCLVALKLHQLIKQEKLSSNMFEMGTLMGRKLSEKLASCPIVVDVRGIGGFWSIEFGLDSSPAKDCFPLDAKVGPRMSQLCYENGITVMGAQCTTGSIGDHILLAPAFVIGEAEVDIIVERISKSCFEMSDILAKEGYLD